MKNLFFFIIVLIFFVLNSCKDNPVTPVSSGTGSIVITSNPGGAAIYLQDNFTGKYTPDTLKNIAFGTYAIKLKFDQVHDSIFNVKLQTSGITNISVDLTNSIASLIIDSDPRGCEIYVNGIPADKTTPDTVKFLKTGNNSITLIKDKLVIDTVIVINKGQNNIFLNYYGTCYITTTPSVAKIIIDGVNTSKVTPDTVRLMNGSHRLELSTSDYYFSTQFSIKPGEIKFLDHSFVAPGNISVNSTPGGADIWLDGSSTGKTTPTTLANVKIGIHTVVIKKVNYDADTSLVTVYGSQTTSINRILNPSASIQEFGPVTIYYGSSLTTSQPNAIILSTGTSKSFSSMNLDSIDVVSTYSYLESEEYYYSGRYTYFFNGITSFNLYDGVPSYDISSGNWYQEIGYSNNTYFYIYDSDQHYSKMIITDRGGSGTSSSPSYVKVKWLYNKVAGDKRFQ